MKSLQILEYVQMSFMGNGITLYFRILKFRKLLINNSYLGINDFRLLFAAVRVRLNQPNKAELNQPNKAKKNQPM